MIFAGASKLQFSKFISNFKSISILSLLTTIINSAIYGLLFYGLNYLLNIHISISVCFLLGCIISPTDPIAATSILNKLGLPKGISSVIEGESLFNDGIGVALFVFVQNVITNAKNENFLWLIGKNLFGAIIIGLVTSFILTISKLDTKLFQNIYFFADKCVINKESFKKKYSSFWEFKTPLNMYYIFVILFIVSDIISIVLKKLAKKYNVWSLILSLITCKKYKYIEIENSKGFIVPQEKVATDNDTPDNIGNIIN